MQRSGGGGLQKGPQTTRGVVKKKGQPGGQFKKKKGKKINLWWGKNHRKKRYCDQKECHQAKVTRGKEWKEKDKKHPKVVSVALRGRWQKKNRKNPKKKDNSSFVTHQGGFWGGARGGLAHRPQGARECGQTPRVGLCKPSPKVHDKKKKKKISLRGKIRESLQRGTGKGDPVLLQKVT